MDGYKYEMIVYLNGNEVWSDDRFVDFLECIELI